MAAAARTAAHAQQVSSDFFVVRRRPSTDTTLLAVRLLSKAKASPSVPSLLRRRLSKSRVRSLAPGFSATFLEDLDCGRYKLPCCEVAAWLLDSIDVGPTTRETVL